MLTLRRRRSPKGPLHRLLLMPLLVLFFLIPVLMMPEAFFLGIRAPMTPSSWKRGMRRLGRSRRHRLPLGSLLLLELHQDLLPPNLVREPLLLRLEHLGAPGT